MAAPPPGRLTDDLDVRQSHSADVSGLMLVPDAVARPSSEAEVRDVLLHAHGNRIAVTPAGSQTSTTGASVTDHGILLSLRAMNRIVDVDVQHRRAVVEPGVLLGELNRALAPDGLMFAPDPTSLDDVTVGGAIACNASGARAFLYGATRPHVHGVTVGLADGSMMEARRSGLEKNTAGYLVAQEPVDWFVGSEGTLGTITRAELSLVPRPTGVVGLTIPFPDETTALACVVAIRDSGLAPHCVEYFDMAAAEIAGHRAPLLYVESTRVDEWLPLLEAQGAIAADIGVLEGDAALREARKFRHAVPATMIERGNARRPQGGRRVSTDWAVPYRLLGGAVAEARRLADAAGIAQPVIYGHVGNGHPHQNFIAHDGAELERIERAVEATLRHVLSLGGTVSAEHGIGKLKKRWLPLQASPVQLGVMRAIKRELDPLGLMAPGNIL